MSKKLYYLYKNLQKKHGNTVTSVKWRNKNSQELRFKILTEITKIDKKDRIIDVGSGLGDLLNYIRKKKIYGKYLGLDFLEEFVVYSNKKYSKDKNSNFKVFNILKNKFPKKYDWIILSGLFNDKHKYAKTDMLRVIKKMFKACNKGIIFNSLSKHVDYEDRTLFYTYPEKILLYCIKNLSKKVVLKTDYQLKSGVVPFEYTICVKK